MSIQAGTHKLGPDNATLRVKTSREGAAAKAGHDLVIDVTSWEATLEAGEDPGRITLELEADAGSLQVHEGTGGALPLSDEDKLDISQTIDDEVLKGQAIEFRSTGVEASDEGGRLRISGDLNMAGTIHTVDFELSVSADGQISGGATLKQSDWGIRPYSALFGALKVSDEVDVVVDAGPSHDTSAAGS